jgi:hypothetical protein
MPSHWKVFAGRCGLLALLSFGLWLPVAQAQGWRTDDYSSDPFNPLVAKDAWQLIAQAERDNNIPAGLLHAMSLVETGQGIRGWVLPWPYTVGVNGTGSRAFASPTLARTELLRLRNLGFVRFNVRSGALSQNNLNGAATEQWLAALPSTAIITLEGKNFARRFANATEAENFSRRLIYQGYNNLDLGMLQVNWRVHGKRLGSLSRAFSPTANLAYAVEYLLEHRQTRDWWRSVGRYHSGTERYANRYIRNVYAMYLRIHRVTPANNRSAA